MRGDLTVERARADDTAAFVALRGQTRENAIPEARLTHLGITADSWAADIRTGQLIGFTAHHSGRLLGYCFGHTGTGEVVVLALLPDAEGQGIGRALLDRVVAALAERGHRRLFLGCSADPTVRSFGFYRHLGWRPTGVVDAHGDEVLALALPDGAQHNPG